MPVTTNMGLTLPTVSGTLGPLWATLINDSLTLVDSHDHSSGKGAAIGVAGLSIQGDLSFNNNRSSSLKSVVFANQTSSLAATDARGLYVLNGNLFFVSGTTDVQITNGTSIAGASGSIAGLVSPASADYNAGTFRFFSNSGVFADLLAQDVTLRNNTSTNTIKLSHAATSSYVYRFPPSVAPQTGSILLMDTGGNTTVSSVATLTASGLLPLATNTTPLGSTSFRWLSVNAGTGNFTGAVAVGSLASGGAISGTSGTFTGSVSSGGTVSGVDGSLTGNLVVVGQISNPKGVQINNGGDLLLAYRVPPGGYPSGSPGTISITNPFNLNTLPIPYTDYCYIVTAMGISSGFDFRFMVVNQNSSGFDVVYWAPSGPVVGFNVLVFGV